MHKRGKVGGQITSQKMHNQKPLYDITPGWYMLLLDNYPYRLWIPFYGYWPCTVFDREFSQDIQAAQNQ